MASHLRGEKKGEGSTELAKRVRRLAGLLQHWQKKGRLLHLGQRQKRIIHYNLRLCAQAVLEDQRS